MNMSSEKCGNFPSPSSSKEEDNINERKNKLDEEAFMKYVEITHILITILPLKKNKKQAGAALGQA